MVAEAFEGNGGGDLLRVLHLCDVDVLGLLGGRVAQHGAGGEERCAARERPAEQVFEQVGFAEADVDEVDAPFLRHGLFAGNAHQRLQRVRAVGQENVVLVRGDQVENAQRDHS